MTMITMTTSAITPTKHPKIRDRGLRRLMKTMARS